MTLRETHTSTNAVHAAKNTQSAERAGVSFSSNKRNQPENVSGWVGFMLLLLLQRAVSFDFCRSVRCCFLFVWGVFCQILAQFSNTITQFLQIFHRCFKMLKQHVSEVFFYRLATRTSDFSNFFHALTDTICSVENTRSPINTPLPHSFSPPTQTKTGKHTPCMRTPKSPPLLIFTLKYFPLRRLQNCLHPGAEGK